MRWLLMLGIVTATLVAATCLRSASCQEVQQPPKASDVEKAMPVVIFMHDVSKIIDAISARSDVDLSRIGVAGISMGSSTCMVLAWKEPRISVVVGLIGAVDVWYDVTKTPPGKDQDAKREALSPRVRQLVNSIDPLDRKAASAPKALVLANGAKDQIDVESIKKFVKELAPSYKDHPDRLRLLEEPKTGHTVTDRMWSEGSKWLVRHLVENPVRWSH